VLRDYKGAESVIDATDPDVEAARQFARASQQRVGRVIAGKYELIKMIGVGGMGAVFEARHRLTSRRVAVKLIHTSLAENRAHVSRFMREARAAGEIGHPAIVDVLDAGTTEDGLVYMVLELLVGEDLEDAVRNGHLTTAEVIEVAIDVLDCLAAAHDRGVVHRDIKPENVYLTTDDDGVRRTKVLDFGIAKHLRDDPDTSMTRTGMIVGTPDFMSPEQARGDAVDGRTDLWAVGALLHYALTGEPPFVAENYNKLIIRIVTESAPSIGLRRPDLPAPLVAVIDRAMRANPQDRWPDARTMLEALRAAPLPVGAPAGSVSPVMRTISSSGVRDTASAARPSELIQAASAAPSMIGAARPRSRLPLILLVLAVLAVVVVLSTKAWLGGDLDRSTLVTPAVPALVPTGSEVPAPPPPTPGAGAVPAPVEPAPIEPPTSPVAAPARPIVPRAGRDAGGAGPSAPPAKVPVKRTLVKGREILTEYE